MKMIRWMFGAKVTDTKHTTTSRKSYYYYY